MRGGAVAKCRARVMEAWGKWRRARRVRSGFVTCMRRGEPGEADYRSETMLQLYILNSDATGEKK